MKKTFLSCAFALISVASFACTNFIVGSKASADGSIFSSYNCDSFGYIQPLKYFPAGMHAPGSLASMTLGYGEHTVTRTIPQIGYTHGVVGLINDCQVSIVETTTSGRRELVNREGLFDYFALMEVTLQRASSAREAIKIINDLVSEYGYNSSGESFMVCDKNEGWIMEIIGKGEGRKGAVWVALRLPDDCISAYANQSRIRKFPQAKKIDKKLGFYNTGECMYSADCISLAREKGYFDGADEDFSFRDAYFPFTFQTVRACDARVWSFFRHHSDPAEMDAYLPYINGDFDVCDALPLWIKPVAPLTLNDVMNDMRDHYEGTALDMTADMSAGPWGSPYRNQPVRFEAPDGTKMFRERPIGCQQSGATMVIQHRNWLPDEVGGIIWFNMDDATMVSYVPVYCGVDRIPAPFLAENNKPYEFSTESAFWMNNFVANMVYPRWSAMIGDLRDAQKELDDLYAEDQKVVEKEAVQMHGVELVNYLTKKSIGYTDAMMKRWDKLARLLIVKHNDQTMKQSKDGVVVPGRHSSPAYSPAFIEAVKQSTGDRYVNR